MTTQSAYAWLVKHRWLLAFAVVIAMGYSLGKERAMRDNARAENARSIGTDGLR